MSLKPSPIPPVPGVTACVAHAAFSHGNVVMQPWIDIVGGVEVRAEHTLEVLAQQGLHDFVAPRVMVLVVTHAGRTHTPDVAVLPTRFIRLHGWTRGKYPPK
jgi:hypothetical protein